MKKIMNAAGVVAASLTLMAGSALAQDPDLVVFDWPGYEDPEFFGTYIEKHGAEPTFAFFGEEEEAFQKLRAGFPADACLLYTSPSPRDATLSRMPSSA